MLTFDEEFLHATRVELAVLGDVAFHVCVAIQTGNWKRKRKDMKSEFKLALTFLFCISPPVKL